MNTFARNALVAAPVAAFSSLGGLALLQAAQIPFPPELSVKSWAQWVVLAAVVYSLNSLGMFVVERLFGAAKGPGSGLPQRED